MPKPILHSDLAKLLRGLLGTGSVMSGHTLQILKFTSGGVIQEAGEIPPDYESPFTLAGDASTTVKLQGFGEPKPGNDFRFGAASEKEMVGVDKRLIATTRLALTYCAQDYCVYDGIRTWKEQENHVRKGTSKTMQSKHLDGLAVDLVPWINGKPTWDWDGCFKIALAMDRAATELGFAHLIRWGAAWDRKLSDFGGDKWQSYRDAVDEYKARHPGPDFIDGPHYEISGPIQL